MILKTINFDIHQASPLTLLNLMANKLNLDKRNYYLCWYIIELTMIDFNLYKHCHSLLVASTLYLVNKIRKKANHFNKALL